MYQLLGSTTLVVFSAFCAAACGASTIDTGRPSNDSQSTANAPAAAHAAGGNVTDPSAPISERFATLDDYLAFLERTQAPVDGPWYREVKPGIYELQTGGNLHLDGPNPSSQTFTREELKRKFGFSR